VTATSGSFEVGSSEAGSRFECSLDGAAYVACSSLTSYAGLGVGEHRFAVRATDAAGNTDPSPAVRTWTIVPPADTTAPETTISAGPSGTVTATSASFEFGSEAGSRFECSLDGAAFAACSSPASYSGIALGEHSFAVRAIDPAANTDPSPALRTWTVVGVSTVPPQPPSPAPPPPPLPLPPVEPPEAGAAAPPATRATMRFGTARPDVLRGTAGRDVIRGLGGNDVLYGFAGDDVLSGGRGRDRLLAGLGNDVAHAADGARDMIACGPGRDLVYADRADRVGRDCERVRRSRVA
jgi:hypothetical protein